MDAILDGSGTDKHKNAMSQPVKHTPLACWTQAFRQQTRWCVRPNVNRFDCTMDPNPNCHMIGLSNRTRPVSSATQSLTSGATCSTSVCTAHGHSVQDQVPGMRCTFLSVHMVHQHPAATDPVISQTTAAVLLRGGGYKKFAEFFCTPPPSSSDTPRKKVTALGKTTFLQAENLLDAAEG